MKPRLPGLPIASGRPDPHDTVVFTHIPRLREHLSNGGWPGILYAQVCVHNLRAAQDRDVRPAHLTRIEDTSYFTVVGPAGRCDMALVGTGEPIPGACPDGGERLFFTDGEAEGLTGLPVKDVIWFRQEPAATVRRIEEAAHGAEIDVAQAPDRTGEGPEGDARVRAGPPAKRKPGRPKGSKSKTGRGYRLVGIPPTP